MSTVLTSNDKIAGLGTTAFHVVLIALLFLVKCPGSGGGGGNDGLGNTGYMSMDVAGFGNSVDGWGPTEDAATPETTPEKAPVEDDTPSLTDDTAVPEAPVVDKNKKENKKPNNTKQETTKPTTTTPTPQKPSKGLTDAFGNLGGNGNTSGSGNQGTEDGTIGGKGVMGGGGSQGTGGGQGGGTGTGTGAGTGSGVSYSLAGRKLNQNSIKKEAAPDVGKVVVDIWVDKNGNVTKAVTNPSLSNTTNSQLYSMAEKAAKNAKFSPSETGANEQKGTITINFVMH